MGKLVLRWFITVAMVSVGIFHFVNPGPFVQIVPPWLPNPLLLVQISGVAEIAGGVGLQIPALRRAAAFGLILLYIAVFPANIHQAVNDVPIDGKHVSPWFLWGRLPLQILFIWLAWQFAKKEPQAEDRPRS